MKKRFTGTQIVAKLRQADAMIGQGKTVPEVCKKIEVSHRRITEILCRIGWIVYKGQAGKR